MGGVGGASTSRLAGRGRARLAGGGARGAGRPAGAGGAGGVGERVRRRPSARRRRRSRSAGGEPLPHGLTVPGAGGAGSCGAGVGLVGLGERHAGHALHVAHPRHQRGDRRLALGAALELDGGRLIAPRSAVSRRRRPRRCRRCRRARRGRRPRACARERSRSACSQSKRAPASACTVPARSWASVWKSAYGLRLGRLAPPWRRSAALTWASSALRSLMTLLESDVAGEAGHDQGERAEEDERPDATGRASADGPRGALALRRGAQLRREEVDCSHEVSERWVGEKGRGGAGLRECTSPARHAWAYRRAADRPLDQANVSRYQSTMGSPANRPTSPPSAR